VPSLNFIPYSTVIGGPALANGYFKKVGNTPIPDNATLYDTLNVPLIGTLNDISVLLAIQHNWTPDLDISLRAPNGTERVLSTDNGNDFSGTNRNQGYWTVFDDSAASGQTVASTLQLAPWSAAVKPQAPVGLFGGTQTNGNWILIISDDLGGNTGTLLGWGIRINNAVVVGNGNLSNTLPEKFNLYQNYPNPFNPVTNIKFDLPKDVHTKIVVYDILGREVRTILNEFSKAGSHQIEFNAAELASGIYFYRIEAGDYVDTKKLMLLK
jgi:subtilisin-like proprotein convertase family protein